MKRNGTKLTKTQGLVLAFVKSYQKSCGWPPTGVEINKHFKWTSPNAARQHLQLIEKKGYIKLVPNIARGIQIL